ncbi:MAG: hypothetical protein U0228_26580 [Myxococcaceae bacterium]
MATPSKDWKEVIAPGEAALHEQLGAQLGELQKKLGASRGIGRGLHRKPNIVARAKFEVKADIPAHLKVGLFSEARAFDAVVRFSNGGPIAQQDAKPDVRGIGVKVLGVGGKKLIPGMENAPTQDFLAILTPSVPFRNTDDFIFFVLGARNPLTLLPKVLMRFGFGAGLKLLGTLQKGLGAPRCSLHTNRYFTPLPIRFGPFAAKYCFTPVGPQGVVTKSEDLGAELAGHLKSSDATWAFQVQLFADEATTPIEDPTVQWSGEWITLATLTLPKQEGDGAFADWAEKLSFDPWHAQEELRPLGEMMRARSVAYRISTQNRGVSPEPEKLP